MEVSIQQKKIKYNDTEKAFTLDGSLVPFQTTYELINDLTGKTMKFDFDHSTGSEWEEDTLWIYKNEDKTLELRVTNYIAPGQKEAYLKAKTRR